MTKNSIEKIANDVLQKYVFKGGVYKQFNNILKNENIKYKEIDVDENTLCGVFTKAPNNQKYIMINQNISIDGRKNFTIAHELGHYFLGHDLQGHQDKIINEDCSNKEPIEYESDYFATCLLMPKNKISSAVKSILFRMHKTLPITINSGNYKTWAIIKKDLIKRYGVSETALRYRLKSLNLIKFN